jgi:predicted ribosome quality control (RQC) complex YloA/Tae2 family protein
MKRYHIEEIQIIVGQNVKDNDELLCKYGKTDYIWLHLKSFPSAHVVIMHNRPSIETLHFAASLCKDSTKYKNLKNCMISYTPYTNVCKTNVLGAVNFKSNKKVLTLKSAC